MTRGHDRRATHVPAAVIVLLVAATGSVHAGAPELSLYLRPFVRLQDSTSADRLGLTNHFRTTELGGQYRLNLKHELFPYLRYAAGGVLDDQLSFVTNNEQSYDQHLLGHNLTTAVYLGRPVLGLDASYTRRQNALADAVGGQQSEINENVSLLGRAQPEGLPQLNVRLTHVATRDGERRTRDLLLDEFHLSTIYDTLPELDLRYTLLLQRQHDRLSDTRTSAQSHALRAAYTQSFWERRLVVAVDYSLSGRRFNARAGAAGGTVATQLFPVAGRSAIESFPADPTRSTLSPNPALIDGDVTGSANLDLGFGASLSGDTAPRDIGVEFADATTAVNTFYVGVDRQLTSALAQQLSWEVYVSDDNAEWTLVAQSAPVVYDPFQNRFELTIESTSARYFKVVTSPLPAGATADQTLRELYVTELQVLMVELASEASGARTDISSIFNATVGYKLTESGDLQATFAVFFGLNHSTSLRTSYRLVEALVYQRRFGKLSLSGRLARDDQNEGSGQMGGFTWTASGTYVPLRTLKHTLAYSGQWRTLPDDWTTLNSFSISNSADVYRGISLLYTGSAVYRDSERAPSQVTLVSRVGAALVPHRTFKLTGLYVYSRTRVNDPDPERRTIFADFVEGSASFAPVPAFVVAGQIAQRRAPKPRLLASFSAGLTLFPDGNLHIGASYGESIDDANDGVTRRATASVRWNITPRMLLDSSFSHLRGQSDIGWSRTYLFLTTFSLAL